jgi:hypothetical protein
MRGQFTWIALIATALSFAASAVAQDSAKAPDDGVRSRLIGAWRLIWDEDRGPNGKTVLLNETGIIMYTADGHMAVQIRTNQPSTPGQNAPVQYDQGGYEGYYGTYEVNEKEHTVTHHVEGALVKDLIGKDLTRVYKFEGKQLVLRSSRADEHWAICWEHY